MGVGSVSLDIARASAEGWSRRIGAVPLWSGLRRDPAVAVYDRAMLVVAERLGAVVISGGAILLLWAGAPKLAASTWSRRATGLAEVVSAVVVLLGPGRLVAALLAAIFLIFTLVHIHGARAGATGCDCFGEAEHVDPRRAAVLTALVTLLAAGAAAVGAPSVRQLASHDAAVLAWLPTAALAAALAMGLELQRHRLARPHRRPVRGVA